MGVTEWQFCQDTADAICMRLASGESLRAICRETGTPSIAAIYRWMDKNPEFAEQYARAREWQADTHVDEIVDIADTEEDPAKARVRIDARKWSAGKMKSKAYGEKLDVSHGGGVSINIIDNFAPDNS